MVDSKKVSFISRLFDSKFRIAVNLESAIERVLDSCTSFAFIVYRMLLSSAAAREYSELILLASNKTPLYLVVISISIVVSISLSIALRAELSEVTSVTNLPAIYVMFIFKKLFSGLILSVEIVI